MMRANTKHYPQNLNCVVFLKLSRCDVYIFTIDKECEIKHKRTRQPLSNNVYRNINLRKYAV